MSLEECDIRKKFNESISYYDELSKEEGIEISQVSVNVALSFLLEHPVLKYPEIELTDEGNIALRWGTTKGGLFYIRITNSKEVDYVIFPIDKEPISVEGSNINIAYKEACENGFLQWGIRERKK